MNPRSTPLVAAKLDPSEEHVRIPVAWSCSVRSPGASRAANLMHLEENRRALDRETETFLRGDDAPPDQPHARDMTQEEEEA